MTPRRATKKSEKNKTNELSLSPIGGEGRGLPRRSGLARRSATKAAAKPDEGAIHGKEATQTSSRHPQSATRRAEASGQRQVPNPQSPINNSMLNPDQKILIEFVEDRAARLSVRKRIKVYRGLADFIEDKAVAAPLVKKAQILEDAESKCAQLNLKFQ